MDYTPDDYATLYGDHWVTKSSRKTRLLVWVLIVGWILALMLVGGCDGEAAKVTAQIEEEAHEKKVAVMSMPCTWVAQCPNLLTDCPVQSRVCVKASQ